MGIMKKQDGQKWKNRAAGCIMLSMAAAVCLGGTLASAKAITSREQARNLAKQKVKSAKVTEVEADTDDGVSVYEVSLRKGSKEYTLKYRQSDGKLMEYEWELPDPWGDDQGKANASRSKIRKKAMKYVKNAKLESIRTKIDDGRLEYKVILHKGSYRYTLVYDAKQAKLTEYEQKYTGAKKSSSASSSKDIGTSQAQAVALKKVPGATVVKIERDHENGTTVYEVELRKGNYEYEIVIDAKSGKILHTEKEYDD